MMIIIITHHQFFSLAIIWWSCQTDHPQPAVLAPNKRGVPAKEGNTWTTTDWLKICSTTQFTETGFITFSGHYILPRCTSLKTNHKSLPWKWRCQVFNKSSLARRLVLDLWNPLQNLGNVDTLKSIWQIIPSRVSTLLYIQNKWVPKSFYWGFVWIDRLV